MHPTKQERSESDAIEQNKATSIVQILWGCYAFNVSPQEAAQQVVSDLYEHLSHGGKVSVHVEALDGTGYSLEVTAKR